ncbi:hypothetical protein UPYG_G00235810 [Umbra pygmaea]|uniref:SEA domain-containing protein n=1 Tax=Umbra pygmaea TaxID=75934 RepID=A0ABD0X4T6_UMBPY
MNKHQQCHKGKHQELQLDSHPPRELQTTSRPTPTPPISVTVDTIEVSTDVTVELNTTFKEEYRDPSTLEYKYFVNNFTNTMTEIYKSSVKNFNGIKIIELRKGSVVVEHDVLLRIENGKNMNNDITQSEEEIKHILKVAKNCTTGDEGCLGIAIIGDVIVKNATFDIESVCKEAGIADALKAYYHAVEIDGRLVCVSPCASEHNRSKQCNTGTCRMSQAGPVCSCNTDYWYLDSDCYGPIRKSDLLAALLTLAGIVIAAVAVVVVYVPWRRRQIRRSQDLHTEQVNQWLTEDFEWPKWTPISGDGVSSNSTTVLTENDPNPPYGGRVGLQYNTEGESPTLSYNPSPSSPYNGTQTQVTSRMSENPYPDHSSWENDRDAKQNTNTQPEPTTSSLWQDLALNHPDCPTQFKISRPEIKPHSEV